MLLEAPHSLSLTHSLTNHTKPEVAELDSLNTFRHLDQNIFRLEVSVHDALAVEILGAQSEEERKRGGER